MAALGANAPFANILNYIKTNFPTIHIHAFSPPEFVEFERFFGMDVRDIIRRLHKRGERREKYNPLVRLDTINGADPELSKGRVEFTKLTPLYPQERLRLETEPHIRSPGNPVALPVPAAGRTAHGRRFAPDSRS